MHSEGEHRPPLNHTKRLGNLEFLGYLKSQADTVHTIFSIEKFLAAHPSFYLNSLLTFLKGRSLEEIKTRITRQYEQLLSGSSFLQRMNASIQARNKCISKIRRDITKASKFLSLFHKEYLDQTNEDAVYLDWVEAEGYSTVEVDASIEHSIQLLSVIFADMSRLRDMTIYVVDSIHAWRMEIQEHTDRCQQHSPVHYFHSDSDIYETVLEDTNFIWKSKLSSYIWMEAKQDPFFIRNVIHVEERENKTPLEKYFLEILYPKEQITVQKSLKCFEMLFFKFKPKLANRFEEEELLIENYLKLELENHQFDQQFNQHRTNHSNVLAANSNQSIVKSEAEPHPEKELSSPQKKNRLNIRGWVFQSNPIGKNRQKVSRIVENHKEKLNIIKTFNIANYAQKNSIALAYLSQTKPLERPQNTNNRIIFKNKERTFFSEGEQQKIQQKQGKQIESEPEVRFGSQSRMFRSLSKLHPVILQDPKEHLPDTPKHRSAKKHQQKIPQKVHEIGRQPSLNHVKLNSFEPLVQQDDKIEIQSEETPLNMKQFFEVFRANTNRPLKRQMYDAKKQGQPQKVITFKKFLEDARKQRAKSLYSRKPPILQIKKRKPQPVIKQKSPNRSHDSYKQFTAVPKDPQGPHSNSIANELKGKDITNIFLNLKAKSIPYDLIIPYIKHISSQLHTTSHSFTDFKTAQVLKKLSDPFIHCIIFDIFTEKQEHVGQVILSESISGRGGKLKYHVQFMNIHVFQFVISTMLRVSEELLATSPSQEVVFPLIVNKTDIVSMHFIELIDNALRQRVGKFGQLAILEKTRPAYMGMDVRDRLYVFTSNSNLKREYQLGLKMMGNYRSLQFQAKCLVLCSNFRLRSKNLFKDTLRKYRNVSLGELFVLVMSKILTKFHLKQLKAASYSIDSEDELSQLLKRDVFVRNIMHNLMYCLKEQRSQELLLMTIFSSMGDLLHYLRYKKHELHFDFQFLEQSRFILNHQLIIGQFDQEISLDFSLTANEEIYVMHNHKHLPVTMITSKTTAIPIYLLPSANQKLKIFFMSASEYEDSTDQMDLFSYINYFLRETHSETNLNEVPAVVLPNLKQNQTPLSKVRMYDGFFKLFPEREFYTAARLTCFNHWESYYPPAVIHTPKEASIVIEFPFIVGFYDTKLKYPLAAFLYRDQHSQSP